MAKYVNLDDCEVVYCGSDGDYEKYNIPYDMPTADVVEVVRCKDCGHSCKYNERWVAPKCDDVVWCRNDECSRDPEWFCAEGYRREL